MSAPKLVVAYVGAGIFAKMAHAPALKILSDRYEVRVVCNRTIERALELAADLGVARENVYSDYQKVLAREDIQAVAVCLPPSVTVEYVTAALKAGKHILVEKPIASSLEGARAVVKLAKANPSKVVFVAENFAYKPSVQEMARIVKSGVLGNIVTFNLTVMRTYRPDENPYLRTAWRRNPEHPGGYLSDGGVHFVALITCTLGSVKEVAAFTRQIYEEHGADDTLSATLYLQSGPSMSSKSVSNADAQVTGTFNLTFSASALPCQTLSIYGTNGTAVWDDHVVTVYTKDGKQAEPFKENAAAREDITNEFKDFHLAASFSAPAKLSLKIEDTFHHFAIIVAALRSAQSKKVETVPLPDE